MGDDGRGEQELRDELRVLRARVAELETLLGPTPGRPPLELLLENSPDVITLLDSEGRMLYLNRTFAPRTLEDVLGQNALDFMRGTDRTAFARALERAVASADVQRVEVATENGQIWETRLVPLSRDGAVFAVMGIGTDLTQRRAAEEALRQSHKLEAIGRVTAGIAHNFNNMLLVVQTNLRLGKLKLGAESPLHAHIEDAEHAARRAADLSREMMTFTRRGANGAKREPADMNEIAGRAVATCQTTFDPRLRLRFEASPAPAPALLDASAIEHALVNLLGNARDAVRNRPEPEISVIVDAGELPPQDRDGRPLRAVRVRVRDNGHGMSEDVRARVFEPFFTTKEIGLGTGLGLATVYGTALDHRGQISCESVPGAGTTFTLLIPAV
ncbi:MAG: nitrogen regulation protein NR(II) [Polyangiales bacterium]